MSADVIATAVRASHGHLLPYVFRVGYDVVLVYSTQRVRDAAGRVGTDARFHHVRFSSAGLARAVEARVMDDLRNWPEHAGHILRVSAMYVEAGRRFARLRARREVA